MNLFAFYKVKLITAIFLQNNQEILLFAIFFYCDLLKCIKISWRCDKRELIQKYLRVSSSMKKYFGSENVLWAATMEESREQRTGVFASLVTDLAIGGGGGG
jgi:hypothetical protein